MSGKPCGKVATRSRWKILPVVSWRGANITGPALWPAMVKNYWRTLRRLIWTRLTVPWRPFPGYLKFSHTGHQSQKQLQAVELRLAVKCNGHHVITGIRQVADQVAVFKQRHADFMNTGL